MTEPILDPDYWKVRLRKAAEPHHAIFKCPLPLWQQIEAKHREILARTIGSMDSVLDAGCGWGRLVDMMPKTWHGRYYGVDLSPDFIRMAKVKYDEVRDDLGLPRYWFGEGNLLNLEEFKWSGIQWGILISMRPMVIRNCGDETWYHMRMQLRKVVRKLLFLEYDPTCPGSVEVFDE